MNKVIDLRLNRHPSGRMTLMRSIDGRTWVDALPIFGLTDEMEFGRKVGKYAERLHALGYTVTQRKTGAWG